MEGECDGYQALGMKVESVLATWHDLGNQALRNKGAQSVANLLNPEFLWAIVKMKDPEDSQGLV